MPIIIAITVIFILSFIPYIIWSRKTPSEKIIEDIYENKKPDSGIPDGFIEFLQNNINENNRYKPKNNIYE